MEVIHKNYYFILLDLHDGIIHLSTIRPMQFPKGSNNSIPSICGKKMGLGAFISRDYVKYENICKLCLRFYNLKLLT